MLGGFLRSLFQRVRVARGTSTFITIVPHRAPRNGRVHLSKYESQYGMPDHGSRPETPRPGACYAQMPGRSRRSLQRLCGRQAALRRAGAFRVARALRAGLRRALPERLAVDFFVARLVAFFFAILAMSLLSLSRWFFCPIRIDNY